MDLLVALAAGLLFSVGLLLSGMTNPETVLGFLDVAGHWNPTLGFVMVGAIAVAAPAFAWMRYKGRTLRGQPVTLPDRRLITPQLVIGSAIFGIGWGLAGLCPGPALVLVGRGLPYALTFAGSMAIGMLLESRFTVGTEHPPARPSGNPL
jgi:uncharacterized membrane protein YedE/YeeE